MKKLLGIILSGSVFLFSSPVHAGHDLMEMFRQNGALMKKESCSNQKTSIEDRSGEVNETKYHLLLIILEPDQAIKKSEFYTEENKDFYSLIFYKLVSYSDAKTYFYIKQPESGNLEQTTWLKWLNALTVADANAVKSLLHQKGSDCKTSYQSPEK